MSRIDRARELRRQIDASITIAKKFVRIDELSSDELDSLKVLYPNWVPERMYSVDEVVKYNGELYKVIQGHTSQDNWTPDKTPAMFNKVVPDGVIPEWEQPLGAHDAYKVGDKVIFKGKVYESTMDGNTYSPESYPQGWKEIE